MGIAPCNWGLEVSGNGDRWNAFDSRRWCDRRGGADPFFLHSAAAYRSEGVSNKGMDLYGCNYYSVCKFEEKREKVPKEGEFKEFERERWLFREIASPLLV
jgi:hypothetical protein